MKTDHLIAALAADAAPARPLGAPFWAAAGAGALACFALMAATLGLRPGLGAALAVPGVAVKSLLPLLLALGAAALALRLDRPTGWAGRLAPALLAVPAAAAVMAAATLAAHPPALWARLTMGDTMVWCVVSIPLLGLPVLGALLAALRRGAPVSPGRAGLAAGLAAGAAAAFVYSLHCAEDSPLFFGAWYTTGIAVVTALGGALGSRALRW